MILAIDGGGSKTDAALFDDAGRIVAQASGGPGNMFRDAEGATRTIVALWATLQAQTGAMPDQTRACVALAGLSAAGAPMRVRAALPGFAALHVVSDGYAALADAAGAGPGTLIIVGTGVSGLMRDQDGRVRSASGWGFPAGDRGGGAWLGFGLVQAWLERLDGTPHPDSVLWDAVVARAGAERPAILAWLREAGPAAYAALAPAIVMARDAVAEALLTEAAGHLHRLAVTLGSGRALALSGGLAAALAPRLPAFDVRLGVDPLRGAWRIARGEVDAADPTIG